MVSRKIGAPLAVVLVRPGPFMQKYTQNEANSLQKRVLTAASSDIWDMSSGVGFRPAAVLAG